MKIDIYNALRLLRVRVETIIDLNLVSDGLVPDSLEEAYGNYPEISDLLGMTDEQTNQYDVDDFIEWLDEECITGFLICCHFPTIKYTNETIRHISWGSYYQEWFYAPSYEQVLLKAINYAQYRDNQAKEVYLKSERC